ncbi:MAG: FecR domain-containing protein [Candidatus Omnitrophica bacterium]|nr:FecR domain-containing protein [Candidatus Omnitrophota bacterium]MDD5488881.1 FecR domain-containing protein [Candidatus Omnitrophota bacterium]
MVARKIFTFLCLATIFIAGTSYGVERSAVVGEITGSATIIRASGESDTAKKGAVLFQGDGLETEDFSSAVLLLMSGAEKDAEIELDAGSRVKLTELATGASEEEKRTLLDLAVGEVLIRAKELQGEGSSFEVKTPTSIVAVRGTTFSVKVEAVGDPETE